MLRKSTLFLFMTLITACANATGMTPTITLPAPTQTAVPLNTSTITSTSLPTHTSTPQAIILTFTKNAFCRRGPSTQYFDIGSFKAGDTTQAVGRNDAEPRWWYVLRAEAGYCWVSESTVELNPAAEALPVREPEKSLPQTPPDLWVDRVCKQAGFAITLNWAPSSTADGYIVYVNGEQRQDIKKATQKSYVIKLPKNEPVSYSFEAYNSIGTGERITFEDACP
jgi:hypothetical protein